MNVPAGTGADGSANGVVDVADYIVWRKMLGAQAASAATVAFALAPMAATVSPETRPALTTASAREADDRFAFEMPLSRIEKNSFVGRFGNLTRDAGAIQRSTTMELNALLLQAFKSDPLTNRSTLVTEAFDERENDLGANPWVVDEVLERLYSDVIRSDEFHLSARR
jgi:hypothetical protein